MKIVINAFSARLGGGKTYLRNLLTRLPMLEGLEIHVLAPDDLELPIDKRIQRVSVRWPTKNPILRTLWEKWCLPRYLSRNNIEVLFCPGGVVATRTPKGCKTVTMFRNMIPFDQTLVESMPWGFQRVRNLLLRTAMLKSMTSADLTIFISEYARSLIEGIVAIPNAATVPHGIAPIFRAEESRHSRPQKAPEGKFLLYVSRLDLYKHHLEIAKAFLSLPDEFKREYSLVFLGESDLSAGRPLLEFLKEVDVTNCIQVLGAMPHNELPAWYQHAEIILFASSCENCPNILLEAMASGRPVLSSNVMPMPEFGGSGLVYFDPRSPQDIARAVSSTASSSARMEAVGAAALQQSKKFNWDVTAQKTWRLIAELNLDRQHSSNL